jgi:hypothetical protein
MPTMTAKMNSSVPCDGNWHRIFAGGGLWGNVFIQYLSPTCTFTARLIDDAPVPPPPGPPALPPPPPPPIVKREMVIPIAGGWRGLNANFQHFEVKCEPPAGGHPEGEPPAPAQPPQQMPDVQTTSRRRAPPGGLHECAFEWYMII